VQRIIHTHRNLVPATILLAITVIVPLTPLSHGRTATAGGTTVTTNGQVFDASLASQWSGPWADPWE
jgi:hypothetical protein